MTNAKFAKTNKEFVAACYEVKRLNRYENFEPSTRQASKWRNKKGIAYKLSHNIAF